MFHSFDLHYETPRSQIPQSLRSRTGCLTCRKKRVKCSEEKPACDRCQRSKSACTYGLRLVWEEENFAKGLSHGRARTGSKAKAQSNNKQRSHRVKKKGPVNDGWNSPDSHHATPRSSSPWNVVPSAAFVNITATDMLIRCRNKDPESRSIETSSPMKGLELPPLIFESDDQDAEDIVELERDALIVAPISMHRSLALFTKNMPSLSNTGLSTSLFTFFEKQIAPQAVLADEDCHNPCRRLILPLAFQSDLTCLGLLLTAAHSLCRENPGLGVVKMELQHALVTGLRTALRSKWTWEEIMIPTVQLCSISIHGCDPSWVAQLTCYRDIVLQGMRRPDKLPLDSPIYRFFFLYFAKHIVLAKTAYSVENAVRNALMTDSLPTNGTHNGTNDSAANMSWTSSNALSTLMPAGNLSVPDPWLGFSIQLLQIISEIADIRQHLLKHLLSVDQLATQLANLKAALLNLTQPLVASADTPPTSLRSLVLQHQASSYQHAALLFLHATSTSPFLSPMVAVAINPVLTPSEVTMHAQTILHLIDLILDTPLPLTVSWPLWPLFMAACVGGCHGEGERRLASDLFTRAQEKTWFENIAPAQKVAELVWHQHDARLAKPPSHRAFNERGGIEMGHVPCYEWESILMKLGWNLSLA